jgi:tRNA-binding EMAP/Myf-like protein
MKFSLSWLKEHLDTDASAEEIADKLTNIGLEVEELSNPAEALAPFTVAKVLTAEKHPQADKLQVLTVDAGTGEKIQVVCGAPNARAGMLGVFGAPGAYIPGSDITLKVAAIRGVESRGMMCSARELELGDDHNGIIELPDDAPVGTPFTNYVMIDLGRPSHAYDIAKLKGGLTARAAKPGEKVLALNEKEYALEPFMTVIADDAHVHDIGGIMGGEDSGVSEATTDVMLEVAYFTPERIARSGQALGLTSDARSRFERGVDPAFLDDGLAILSGLILDICGGEASAPVRAGEPPIEKRTIRFDYARTSALGAVDVPKQRQKQILDRLGFEVNGADVTVPTWRRDVDGPADLVEEITRITGYDQVPSTSRRHVGTVTSAPFTSKPRRSRICLNGASGVRPPPAVSMRRSPGASSRTRKPRRSGAARGGSPIRSART